MVASGRQVGELTAVVDMSAPKVQTRAEVCAAVQDACGDASTAPTPPDDGEDASGSSERTERPQVGSELDGCGGERMR